MGDILIGTSGFSYDDWRGFFYPNDMKKADMLAYYARKFRAVEINSSYYGIPPPSTFERMAQKTPDGFRFSVKANKDITHAPDVDLSVCRQFVESVQPLIDARKLGCLLAQYPWSFKRTETNASRVRQLRGEFGDIPLVVEFRNYSWASEETFALLKDLGIGYCCVDEPRLRGLMPSVAMATSDLAYVRFHGRNAEKWFEHEAAWQRYDYLYSRDELEEWEPKVKRLASKAKEAYLFFNNHYQGKAAQNAQMFAQMLGAPPPVDPDLDPGILKLKP